MARNKKVCVVVGMLVLAAWCAATRAEEPQPSGVARKTNLYRAFSEAYAKRQLAAVAAAEETEGIPWRIGLYREYKRACRLNKPLVVCFYQFPGKPCEAMQNTLFDRSLSPIADRAIFVWQDVGQDDTHDNVRKVIKQLGLKDVPVVAVFDVSDTKFDEVGRVTGYYEPAETLQKLQALLDQSQGARVVISRAAVGR